MKPKLRLRREIADVGLKVEGFAEAEEVVGLVVETDEGAGEAGDTTVETDGVLALFFEFQEQIDGGVVGIFAALGVLLDLERLEVVELVEAQEGEVPELRVVELAFLDEEFAADDLVAGDGVAGELDAGDVKLLALIDIDVEVDELLGFVKARRGAADELDVAVLAVGLAQGLEALAEEGGV